MGEYTKKMEEANASLFRNAQSAWNILDMVEQTTTIKNVKEVLHAGINEVREAYRSKVLTHTQVQQGARQALRRAMNEGIAHELRQVGDDLQITTVLQEDVTGTVLAVGYPDGGISYYPTENKDRSRRYAGE
jgi:hypothetical protein